MQLGLTSAGSTRAVRIPGCGLAATTDPATAECNRLLSTASAGRGRFLLNPNPGLHLSRAIPLTLVQPAAATPPALTARAAACLAATRVWMPCRSTMVVSIAAMVT
jgi:hypothetical protein